MEKCFLLVNWNLEVKYIKELKYSKAVDKITEFITTDSECEALVIDDYTVATLICNALNDMGHIGFTTMSYLRKTQKKVKTTKISEFNFKHKCPRCNYDSIGYLSNYCSDCGQALDWEK